MTRTTLIALTAATLLAATGCTSANRIVGNNLTHVGHWYGELGITGHLNKITVQPPSRLTKLSILGDANEVIIEDHVTLGKIEVWGANNTVSVPQHLAVRLNLVGGGIQIVRRLGGPDAADTTAGESTPSPEYVEVATPVEETLEPTGEPVAEPADEEPAPPADADDDVE